MWFRKKRLERVLDSFNEDLYRDQEDLMVKIREIAGKINGRLLMGNAAETRATRIGVENHRGDMQTLLAGMQHILSQHGQDTVKTNAKLDKILTSQQETKRRQVDQERSLLLSAEQSTTEKQSLLAENVIALVTAQLVDQANHYQNQHTMRQNAEPSLRRKFDPLIHARVRLILNCWHALSYNRDQWGIKHTTTSQIKE